jgi:hypothetical protein
MWTLPQVRSKAPQRGSSTGRSRGCFKKAVQRVQVASGPASRLAPPTLCCTARSGELLSYNLDNLWRAGKGPHLLEGCMYNRRTVRPQAVDMCQFMTACGVCCAAQSPVSAQATHMIDETGTWHVPCACAMHACAMACGAPWLLSCAARALKPSMCGLLACAGQTWGPGAPAASPPSMWSEAGMHARWRRTTSYAYASAAAEYTSRPCLAGELHHLPAGRELPAAGTLL